MKSKFLLLFGLVLCLATISVFENTSSAKSEGLEARLPDSDGVIVIDAKRLVESALPSMLSVNPKMLLKIDSEVTKFKEESGLDLKSFDRIAIGMKYRSNDSFDSVLLARNSSAVTDLESIARTASKGEFEKIKVGSKDVFTFSGSKLLKNKNLKDINGSFFDGIANSFMKSMSGDLALASIDPNTLVFGNKDRVLETLGNQKRISPDLLSKLDSGSSALGAMAVNLPKGMSQFFELDDDELGTNLDAIQSMSGSLDFADGETRIALKTVSSNTERAEELAVTIDAMKGFFAGLLENNKGADKQVYRRMLLDLKIEQINSEISLKLAVKQSDLDVIISRI